jgi:hypothetical protein
MRRTNGLHTYFTAINDDNVHKRAGVPAVLFNVL